MTEGQTVVGCVCAEFIFVKEGKPWVTHESGSKLEYIPYKSCSQIEITGW